MKLTLQHIAVRSTHKLDTWVENQLFDLQTALPIEQATVRLMHSAEASPPYHVSAHLVIPGPDLRAEGRDHTLRAAVLKVMRQLREHVTHRARKPLQHLKSNLSSRAARSRSGHCSHENL